MVGQGRHTSSLDSFVKMSINGLTGMIFSFYVKCPKNIITTFLKTDFDSNLSHSSKLKNFKTTDFALFGITWWPHASYQCLKIITFLTAWVSPSVLQITIIVENGNLQLFIWDNGIWHIFNLGMECLDWLLRFQCIQRSTWTMTPCGIILNSQIHIETRLKIIYNTV